VKWIDQVFEIALERQPQPLAEPVAVAPIAAPGDDKAAATLTTH
jgi:hypothetical protein